MQLLIILALLMYGGKSGAQNLLNEVKPMLENLGGDEMKEALKSAEEISSVLSLVKGFTGGGNNRGNEVFTQKSFEPAEPVFGGNAFSAPDKNPAIAFPLEPISNVADKDITYSLSKYISEN